MSEAFGLWLAVTDCKSRTRSRYAQSIRRAIGAGIVNLSDCTPERLGAYLRSMRERGLKTRTIANELAAFTIVLRALALEGRFSLAQLEAVRLLKPREKWKPRYGTARFLSLEEVERLAAAAATIAPRLELPIRVAAFSGARVGELAKMHRGDFVGLESAQPHLWISELPEFGERGDAKTGRRRLPVCSELKSLVLERCGSTWLFPSTERRAGRRAHAPFINTWTLEHELQFVRRAAALPEDVTFTTLRHTRASWWLQAGVSIYKVASWLGHQVRVAEAHYAGLTPYDPDCERMPA